MDKRQKLSNLRRRAVEKLNEGETHDICQKHLEEKVLIDLHSVQLYGVSDLQKRFDILHDMYKTCTQTLDRTSLELTYHSKMAVTYAKIGQQIKAEEHIQQTLVMCDRCLPCFATIMALNDVLYAYQELCFVNRSQNLLNKAKDHGQLMYHVITCEDEEAVNQWKRIILLFLAMTYLKISHEFEVSDVSEVSIEDIKQARVYISEVKKVSAGIELRREMVLYLCKGRIHERKKKSLAIQYVEKAYELVNEGCLRDTEKTNIENYLALLRTD
jgi:hypothetical protein